MAVHVTWGLKGRGAIPRFKRLFANGDDAKDLTWHANGRNCDGMLRHPADSLQWK